MRGRCLVPGDQHRPLSSPGMVRPKPSSYVGCQQLAMAHTPEEVVIVTRALYPCSVVNCCVSFLCCKEVNCEHIGAVCSLWTQSEGQFTLDTQQCHYDRRNVSRNSDKDFSGVESEYFGEESHSSDFLYNVSVVRNDTFETFDTAFLIS